MKEDLTAVKFMILLQPPFLLGLLAGSLRSVFLLILTAVLVFVMAARVPSCRQRETLWVFVFGTAAFFPADLALSGWYIWNIYHQGSAAAALLRTLMGAVLLLSTELIGMCFVSRLIWREQENLRV